MMRQYRRIRDELPSGVILFFRLGDFYEMFYEDARQAAPLLDIALTRRNRVPMCGVPVHAVESYLAKLMKAGRKVAICDQVEDPAEAKGIVRRELTRIVTPGTVTEETILESNRNHFLAGVYASADGFGLARLDLSTGSFAGEEAATADALQDELKRFAPREVVVADDQVDDEGLRAAWSGIPGIEVSRGDSWAFDYAAARECLTRHFGVHSLDGFGCEGKTAVVCAAGGVLHYVKEELRRRVGHVRSFRVCVPADFLVLDDATCLNLDLVPAPGAAKPGTLLDVLDATRTAMGARELRNWILRPLADVAGIRARHDAVARLCDDRACLGGIRETLGTVRDLERLVARLGSGAGNARDLRAVCQSLEAVPRIREQVGACGVDLFGRLASAMTVFPELVTLIGRAIVPEPPAVVREGGIVQDGYDAELDALRRAAGEGRRWLAEYQAGEQRRTGIRTLKVRHNKVFGYYIEVSRGQVGNVPPSYTRKQTLVNAERFITPELKEFENRIVGAHERAVALEYEIFVRVRETVAAETERMQATARAVAAVDVVATLADRALVLGYRRPSMTDGDRIRIRAGRHPVIEQMPDAERFVPNDALLDGDRNQIAILTGPNMAGKSTYIRQTALIVILAQMGSFVPAEEAEIGVVDRVFTRVGASDDLIRGRSTFMVEMQETANILHHATSASLIVLDEIGRGTSTFDGISIAWAVAEYLHNARNVKAKTLFATHYHELTDLALTLPGVRNYNVLVREKDDRVVFLRKIVPGASDKSYGIQVARLAGLPDAVLERAKEILANLEEGELGESGQPKIARRRPRKEREGGGQLTFLDGV